MLDVNRLSPEYGDPLKMPADLKGWSEKLSITPCGKGGNCMAAAVASPVERDQLITKPS